MATDQEAATSIMTVDAPKKTPATMSGAMKAASTKRNATTKHVVMKAMLKAVVAMKKPATTSVAMKALTKAMTNNKPRPRT